MIDHPRSRMPSCSGWPTAVAVVSTAALSISPRTANANVVPVYFEGGTGGSVLPRGTDAVRIVSEHLEFVEGTQETSPPSEDFCRWLPWHVRADYVLENVTDERVELDVGFPFEGQRVEYDQEPSTSGEIRYLRKFLDWSGAQFARHVGVDVSTVSRWENGQQAMGPIADRLLRMIVGCRQPGQSYPLDRLTEVRGAAARPARIGVRQAKGAWRADAA